MFEGSKQERQNMGCTTWWQATQKPVHSPAAFGTMVLFEATIVSTVVHGENASLVHSSFNDRRQWELNGEACHLMFRRVLLQQKYVLISEQRRCHWYHLCNHCAQVHSVEQQSKSIPAVKRSA